MKSDGFLKHFMFASLAAAALYVAGYQAIEHRRNRSGPWEVRFATNSAGAPTLRIDQPALGITNVELTFPPAALPTNFMPETLAFRTPRKVPSTLPFGECVFMDTTFQPGTLVFRLFGHEIQLMPRVLTLDGREEAWRPGLALLLSSTNGSAPIPLH